jgi:hypothetical protein
LRDRVNRIRFNSSETGEETIKNELHNAIDKIERAGEEFVTINLVKPNDEHWSIIAGFVYMVYSLLSYLENNHSKKINGV